MFNAASQFQINGGIFHAVSGDMNIYSAPPTIGQGSDPLTVLESGLNTSTRQLVGVQRHAQQIEVARLVPYDQARRPPLFSLSHESDESSSSHSVSLLSGPLAPPSPRPNSPLLGVPGPCNSVAPGSSRPEHPARRAVKFSSTYNQERAGSSPQGEGTLLDSNVACLPLSAQDHQTHINIGGNVNQIQHHGADGLHILRHAAASDAFHDSAERYPQPKCHAETRTQILEDLWLWSSEVNASNMTLWLQGPAGAGKSAIAQSFCQKLEAHYYLGASFFFKRGHPSRGIGNKLFPTLAYQLALCQPELKQAISGIVEDDPSILDRALSIQLRKLIIDPCRQAIRNRPLVVVIDGLDECDDQEIQREILRSIGNAIRQGPLPLHFFITSRPEPHIDESFTSALRGIHRSVNIDQSFDDVRTYLLDEFKSSGYFVYASTVVKFIDDKEFRPTERLEMILGIKEANDESPYAALDQLYIQILCQIRARPRLLRILTVVAAKLNLSLRHIEQLLGLELGDVRLTLRGLQSVIGLEDSCFDDNSPPVVHHASFYDFLPNPQRAGIFHVGRPRIIAYPGSSISVMHSNA
ncbi:NACHT domain-containing protein [Mycena sanguinolenta]|uniref:NACHT domain-containing protein n=1 Tax=Mycena sanguinolenta TaxID=230812 RepID=A0A8H7DM87_9AGAR|nr:NACHT domain-containing protein [Mycena sanguinolenta]